MKLTVMERSNLLGILPREGTFDTLKALRKFKESLSLSEAEKAEIRWRLEFKCPNCNTNIFLPTIALCGTCGAWLEPTGQAQWDVASDPNKDIFISATVAEIVVEVLTQMNKGKGRLTEDLLSVYEKFVPVEGTEEK